jgi:thioesterase domain-containing protein
MREKMNWLPIETAPKDGTEILIWMDGKQRIVARWADAPAFGWSDWIETVEGYRLRKNVITHWQPLPEPPAA